MHFSSKQSVIDSKWFKQIIELTGSIEEAMLLSDIMIYYCNRYKAFKIGGVYLYGLIYSAKEYERKLRIPYRKAMNLPKKLVDKGFLKPHSKKFICNRTFYTPTAKTVDSIYKIHCQNSEKVFLDKDTSKIIINTRKAQSFLHTCRSGCANVHKPPSFIQISS